MEQFPHLKFIQQLQGRPRFTGGGSPHDISKYNREHRQQHVDNWRNGTSAEKARWASEMSERDRQNLAPINNQVIPIYIQVNPDLFTSQFDLHSFGIEIISEEEDGFIIGASLDNFQTLQDKIEGFLNLKHGSAKLADFWSITIGDRDNWKPKHILSEALYEQWHTIEDDKIYELEVSVAFDKPIGKVPDATKQGGLVRWSRYQQMLIERDEQLAERQAHFDEFVNHYGERTSSFVDLEDSFGCEVSISGKGLRDLVTNYQFVFDVNEIEQIIGIQGVESELGDSEIEILAPDEDAVEVGVIDSGIMENHKYLEKAILANNSKSYVKDDSSVADYVKRGGHGTKVAGAILYPRGLEGLPQPYKLPCYIRNLRALNGDNKLEHVYPAELMEFIVDDNLDCEIFNLSIASTVPCRLKHMSSWAAMIDKLIYENDVLFIVTSGNIGYETINNYLNSGNIYPNYLKESFCRLANPAQSSFAICVGSVNHKDFEDTDWCSIGIKNEVSGYSRIGTGLWGHIKPDVVEYGGGIVVSKDGTYKVKEHEETATELIRSTLHGGSAIGRDSAGTSFATPKVTYLAALLRRLYRDEDINLIRALIVQGARLPENHFLSPTTDSIRHFGYGIPLIERVTRNSEHRVTFYNTGQLSADQADIYSIAIPSELRDPGNSYDILIEITLAYTARVRRTRQRTNSYLSTWLDWTTSKKTESFNDFKDYALKVVDGAETSYDKDRRNQLMSYPWIIHTRTDHGQIANVNRNYSTVQKDWAVVKSYDFDPEISLAVRGHKGWERNVEQVAYAITVSIEILGKDIPIYDLVRVENAEIEV